MNVYVKKKQIDISQIARIAIQNDAIDTINFYLPKTYEGVDLTTFSWYLVYEYPDKTGGTLLLDTSVGSDYIEAEKSLIETAITGNLKIQLLAVNESQRFQTDPTSITIRPTLNPSSLTDVTIWEEYLTIYQAILLETETARDEILLDAGFIAVSNDLLGYNTIGQVASDLTDVGIVAGISTDVSNVSAIKDDVSDVSLIKDDVSVVAVVATDIGIVATDLALGIASKIKIVSDSIADVTTVAGIQTQVTALGALVDEMVALYAIRADITEVSLIDDAVSALALLATQITALGARTTELDALYAEIDQIAVKATVASVDAAKGTGWTDENLVDHEDRLDTLEGADTVVGSVAKTIKDAVEPIIEDVADHETRIQILEGWHPLNSWADIQKVAKAGVARKYLKKGDLIETTYDGNTVVVEVLGINQDTPPEGTENYQDVITFQFKDCLQNAQYSAPQALYNAVEGLDAGSYTFINSYDSLPYTFTLNQAVPVGGVIVITSWGAGAYEPTVLKTMQADRLTDIETGVAVTQASGGTALAPVNFIARCRYGANLYIESGIRHFLNDNSESYVWVAQGLYDMPSTYGAGGGFLKRLDADFASVIGPVVKKVARATADGGGQDTTEDKVWLLSRVEMGYGTEGVTTGEQVYERWNGATDAERIKLLSGSPRNWWLRPPVVSNQYDARLVLTNGALSSSNGSNSIGLAPGLAVY